MIASKVSFSQKTREALDRPMTPLQRRKIKINRVKEYVRSVPSGQKIRLTDLYFAAGYTKATKSAGYQFIKKIADKGIIKLHGDKNTEFRVVTIPEDVKVTKPAETPEANKTEQKVDEAVNKVNHKLEAAQYLKAPEAPLPLPRELGISLEFASQVKRLAKEYSWRSNDDSLRGFINSLI